MPAEPNEPTAEERAARLIEAVHSEDGWLTEEQFVDGARMDEGLVRMLTRDQFRY